MRAPIRFTGRLERLDQRNAAHNNSVPSTRGKLRAPVFRPDLANQRQVHLDALDRRAAGLGPGPEPERDRRRHQCRCATRM
jgi:hypothetical protein